MDAADCNVVVSEHRREIINALDITFLCHNAVEVRHSLWMSHDGRDMVSPPGKFGKNSRSGIAGRTDRETLIISLPPVDLAPVVPTPFVATNKLRSIRAVCAIAIPSITH